MTPSSSSRDPARTAATAPLAAPEVLGSALAPDPRVPSFLFSGNAGVSPECFVGFVLLPVRCPTIPSDTWSPGHAYKCCDNN